MTVRISSAYDQQVDREGCAKADIAKLGRQGLNWVTFATEATGHHDPVADLAAVFGLGFDEIRGGVRHHCEHDRLRVGAFEHGPIQPDGGRVFTELDDVDHDLVRVDRCVFAGVDGEAGAEQ